MTAVPNPDLQAYAARLLAGTGTTLAAVLDPASPDSSTAAEAIRDGWDAADNAPTVGDGGTG